MTQINLESYKKTSSKEKHNVLSIGCKCSKSDRNKTCRYGNILDIPLNILYQFILNDKKQKYCFIEKRSEFFMFYVDLDLDEQLYLSFIEKHGDIMLLWNYIIQKIKQTIKHFILLKHDTKETLYIFSDREDKENKIHLYYPNLIINAGLALSIRSHIIEEIIKDNIYGFTKDQWSSIIDESVYKANGLRILGQIKPHEKHGYKINKQKSIYDNIPDDILGQLQLTSIRRDNINSIDLLLDINDKGYPLLYEYHDKLFANHSNRNNNNIIEENNSSACDDINKLTEIDNLLDMLDHTKAIKYNRWLDIGIILYNEFNGSTEGFDRWIQYIKDNIPKSLDIDECKTKWNSFDSKKDKQLKIGTLRHFAKLDSGATYSDYVKAKLVLGRINDPEHKVYYDDCIDNFDFSDDVLVKQWLIDTVAIIFDGGKRYCTTKVLCRDEIKFKELPYNAIVNYLKTKLHRIDNTDKKNEKRITVDILFKSIEDLLSYKYIDFLPRTDKKDIDKIKKQKIFNLFTGFKVNSTNNINNNNERNNMKYILHHIKKVYCNDNEENYNYFIGWLSHIIQKPYDKTGVCIMQKSKQGAGKGVFWDFFCKYVIGYNHSIPNTNINKILTRFNSPMKGKILIVCNELKNFDVAHTEADQFKSLITDKFQIIEQKGIDSYEIMDYSNIVVCSNNKFVIKVEEDDRRFFCLELNDCYCKNTKYFNKLLSTLHEQTAKEFYKFLMEWDISNWDRNNIPVTKLKQDLIDHSAPLYVRFMEDVFNREYIIYQFKNGDYRIYLQDLYNEFKTWCSDNGHKGIINKTTFKNNITERYKIICKRIEINKENPKVGFNLTKLMNLKS